MQIREEYSTAVRQKIKDIKIIIISEPIPGLQLRQGERFHWRSDFCTSTGLKQNSLNRYTKNQYKNVGF